MALAPIDRYLKAIQDKVLTPDPEQEQAVQLLQACFERLEQKKGLTRTPGKSLAMSKADKSLILHAQLQQQLMQPGTTLFFYSLIQRLIRVLKNSFGIGGRHSTIAENSSLGCYIWGGVGRGKTLFMDYFYESLPAHINAKRTHFHRFMREVHGLMHQLSGISNPLEHIGAGYAKVYDVICLDEFVVIDITDAMLLAGLTEAFFQNGLMLITTSNAAPQQLYKNGLQRARFLPTIANLERYLEVHHLDSQVDYRLRTLRKTTPYRVQTGLQPNAVYKEFESLFRESTAGQAPSAGTLDINDRVISYLGVYTDLVWFEFQVICGPMRSVADYIELAKDFHTVFISNVPQLNRTLESETRRFIHLVDEFYDAKVKLVLGAAVALHELYTGSQVAFEFERTTSRLIEMQSEDYLAAKHLTSS